MTGTERLQALVTLLSLRDGHTQAEENLYEAIPRLVPQTQMFHPRRAMRPNHLVGTNGAQATVIRMIPRNRHLLHGCCSLRIHTDTHLPRRSTSQPRKSQHLFCTPSPSTAHVSGRENWLPSLPTQATKPTTARPGTRRGQGNHHAVTQDRNTAQFTSQCEARRARIPLHASLAREMGVVHFPRDRRPSRSAGSE